MCAVTISAYSCCNSRKCISTHARRPNLLRFCRSLQNNHNYFMVESHSDFIIDRIRILTRKDRLKAEDVSILYFAPDKNAVEIHNIGLDSNGNLRNVPPGYRDFFIRESDRLLGFDD